jgi:hypothetical protein
MIAYYLSIFKTHPIITVNNINDNEKMNKMVKFLRDEEGATAVEYAIMAVNGLFESFIAEWNELVNI